MNKNVIIILVIMGVILIGGAAFVMMRNPSSPTNNSSNTDDSLLPPPTLIEVPFEYTVKSIGASEIVLNGQEGDIIFPTTNFDLKFISGDRGSNESVEQSALRVGQRVNLDMIPGRSATIYILNSN